jgi:hypothetical protein
MMNPKVNPGTGKPLPFAQQPREFQIAEKIKGIAGFVMCDRSELTRDEKITWYMAEAANFDEAAQAEIRAGVAQRLAGAGR